MLRDRRERLASGRFEPARPRELRGCGRRLRRGWRLRVITSSAGRASRAAPNRDLGSKRSRCCDPLRSRATGPNRSGTLEHRGSLVARRTALGLGPVGALVVIRHEHHGRQVVERVYAHAEAELRLVRFECGNHPIEKGKAFYRGHDPVSGASAERRPRRAPGRPGPGLGRRRRSPARGGPNGRGR